MFEYRYTGKWCNPIYTQALALGLLWIMFTAFFVAAAINSGEVHFYLWSFSFSLLFALILWHRVQVSIRFPTVEVCDRHLILNLATQSRRVYDLELIEGARFFRHVLYFRHDGWPVLAPLPRMPMALRQQLLEALRNG